MSNTQIAARMSGDDYQAYYFWIYAINMILPKSEILSVSYEDSEYTPFDDIIVHYSNFRKNEFSDTKYDRDYIQCKFKINLNKNLTWKDLIDSNYYHNKESILKRAYDLYLKQNDHNFRLILCTSVCFDTQDLFASYISNIENGLNIFKLNNSNDKKTTEMLNCIGENIGCYNKEELMEFLSRLRFYQGQSIHDLKIELKRVSCLANISYDLSKDSEIFTSLIKKANLRRITTFDKKAIEKICKEENLFRQERIKIGIIGIGKIDARIEKLKSSSKYILDLSTFMEDRKLQENFSWNDVIEYTKKFVDSNVEYGKNYLVSFSGIFSVAFLLGKLIGFKHGDIALENRNGIWIKEDMLPNTLIEEHDYQLKEDCDNDSCLNAIICISIGDCDILEDVNVYLKQAKISDVRILHIHNNASDINNNMAWDFVINCNESIKGFIKRLLPPNVHLFYRGPAEIMFMLGQYSNEWGECQIYDFNFQATELKEKKYLKGIKI